MSSDSWPPQLKDWVAKCLGQMTDTNRIEAQAELREVIADAFAAHTLWTTDWVGVQLKSLLPKPVPSFTNNLKRKTNENTTANKKAKKNALKQAANLQRALDPNDQAALNRRAERFQREHELERTKHLRIGGPASLKANQHHAHLFNNLSRSGSPSGGSDDPEADPNVIDWDRATIVGTSQEIFKDYLRLTTEPKPEQIRPYAILQQTLLELKKRWREKCNYNWICSQFKSLRQDLTVQRIKNDFTVQVYEIHARMALESGDMVEYNQCQATLKTLYELGIPGKVEEFTAYRILMLLHGRNRSELNLFVGQLTLRQKADPAVRHALIVQRALSMGNYHALFESYLTAPNMGAYIMDHFIDRERVKALMVITKAYLTIPLSYLQNALAFDSLDAARAFLVDHSAAFFTNPRAPDSQKMLECKPAIPQLSQAFEEKYRKIMIKGAI
ncbi:SAC3/GANP/Nin1/mts3/eIF-3 p25 family-domain-containing protein [Collybia nuda]|uniref:SAC3/GANP/Nin1/mts3/eIF-3 p25 family-domain-containing protein n=1 Tax=Collybia nuda TaxID=64659 RepID=A0A9P5Y675_9AGAR|nr:SAC3/GANP/Nin1/mts3/eIF-3 p25 family-domain-containing protein [Collybia nuda]